MANREPLLRALSPVRVAVRIIFVSTIVAVAGVSLSILSRDATYYCKRPTVEMTKGKFSNALADFNKAVKLKPDYVDAYIGRGGAEYKQGNPEAALADYQKAVELKPDLGEAPDLAVTPDAIVTNEIAKQALALFNTKDFDKIDTLAARLRTSKERYADGVWKLSCIYDGLVPANHASEEEWGNRLNNLQDWTLAKPASITARVALANALVAYAWKARGAGEVDTVTTDGWRLFGERLVNAAKVLKDAGVLKEKCPVYWRVMMRDALGLQARRNQFDAIFDKAIKSEPDFENYYVRRVIYLLPRWYGSPGEWQSDLTAAADKIGGDAGNMLYAQVIWNLNQPSYFENPFYEDNVSWDRVDKGFAVIEAHYPDSLAAKIEHARLAIFFNESQAMAFYNRGDDKLDKGDVAGAIVDFTKAIELNPKYAKAYGNRGIAKSKKGDGGGAMEDYNKAIEIKPDYALAYCNRAAAKLGKGDKIGAMADYTTAIEIKPDFAQAYAGRGGLKISNGDNAGGMEDMSNFTRYFKVGK